MPAPAACLADDSNLMGRHRFWIGLLSGRFLLIGVLSSEFDREQPVVIEAASPMIPMPAG